MLAFGAFGGVGFVATPPTPSTTDDRQTFLVGVVAKAFVPIVDTQSFAVEVTAAELGVAYSPSQEAGAVAWWSLRDPADYTLNGGSTAVTQVKNKISGVQITTPINDVPYEAAGGPNSRPCLHPLLTGDRFQSTEAAVVAAINTGNPYLIAFYVKTDNDDATQVWFSLGNTASSSADTRTFGESTTGTPGTFTIIQTTPSNFSGVSSALHPSSASFQRVFFFSEDGTTHKVCVNNGTPETLASGIGKGSNVFNQFGWFARVDVGPDGTAPIRCSESLVFCGPTCTPDAAMRTRLDSYMIAEWA